EVKNASGLFNLTRNLGGAFGLAAINTLLSRWTDAHVSRLSEHVAWGAPMAEERLAAMTAAFRPVLGPDAELAAISQLSGLVHREAQVMAYAMVFGLLAFIFAAMVGFVFLLRRPAAEGAPPAH
ncbi:MAG: MFS transporter, partial [Pikeienuella sp.]